ncbi:MAG TPA: hypothetical protein VGI45_15575, partial [Terracidiphilus sp.]
MKPFAEPNVSKLASRNLSIDPAGGLDAATTAVFSQYHKAPSKVIRVLDKESQPIRRVQAGLRSPRPNT